ncbi:hypothetical protein NF867_17635 [Solitalea sp. MAHUQ-68]|uniref:Uncharacterized protein n=1 Tax=Solitalea agri TaxID=2953739 RepID=A0A9X2FD57_9SPHI|nr:hypothetical protein [Solitalea agri]MCO4294688.1 hypothetical protein [Solitalea agri]
MEKEIARRQNLMTVLILIVVLQTEISFVIRSIEQQINVEGSFNCSKESSLVCARTLFK